VLEEDARQAIQFLHLIGERLQSLGLQETLQPRLAGELLQVFVVDSDQRLRGQDTLSQVNELRQFLARVKEPAAGGEENVYPGLGVQGAEGVDEQGALDAGLLDDGGSWVEQIDVVNEDEQVVSKVKVHQRFEHDPA